MARPRADQDGPKARERLESAFWEMLAQTSFDDITVSALSARANVNHNTFYYYFDSIEDMAHRVFEDNMMPELPGMLLPLLSAGMTDLDDVTSDVQVVVHFKRACLYARDDSALLPHILRDSISQLWLDTVGLKRDDLTVEDGHRLAFVFGGLVAAIGEMGADATPEDLSAIVDSPLGRGIFESLAQLAGKRGNQTVGTNPSI